MSEETAAHHTFHIDYNAFLNEQGKTLQPLPDFAKDSDTLLELYEKMVLTRLFDKKAIALQRTGRLGTYPSSYGQEAISVAVGHSMHKDDVFCPYYRENGTHLQRGISMEEILLYWGGDERGSQYQNAPEDFPYCIPIASQCLHAAGIAVAIQQRKQARCAVAMIGDGGTSKGDFYEALNLAGAWKLPFVMVINNNQWAISVPRASQSGSETLAQKAIAAGIDSVQVDGNDVIAVHYAMDKAIEKARAGDGPSVIEAITYRLCDHTTADDARRYRPQADFDQAMKKEPLVRFKNYLMAEKLWDDNKEQALITRTEQAIAAAVSNYEATPPQGPEAMFDYLYAQLPKQLFDQREEAIAAAGDH